MSLRPEFPINIIFYFVFRFSVVETSQLTHSLTHSLCNVSLTHLLACCLIYYTQSYCIHSLIPPQLLAYSVTQSHAHSRALTYTLTHSVTHSLSHSLTHSCSSLASVSLCGVVYSASPLLMLASPLSQVRHYYTTPLHYTTLHHTTPYHTIPYHTTLYHYTTPHHTT